MSKTQALAVIVAGDLIYGVRENGRPDLLLVHRTDVINLFARNVASQAEYRFDRDGEGTRVEDGLACTIVSTAALAPEQYQVAIALDRRMASNPEYPDTRLTEDEIQLVLKCSSFFEQRLLPETEALVKRAQKLRAVESLLMLEWDPVYAMNLPPSPYQYSDNVPALVDLLDRAPSDLDVTHFLADIAARHGRSDLVSERTKSAVAALLRLRLTWN